jgi:cytochrome c553
MSVPFRCVAIAAVLLLTGCDREGATIARGQALAQEKGCAACHGADGVGLGASFPNLAGQWPRYLRVQLLKYRSGERENAVMNAQAAGLSQDEIIALSAFYGSK